VAAQGASRNRIVEIGVDQAVFCDIEVSDKTSAIRLMARILGETRGFTRDQIESVANAMLGREELGSTGIGQGVATPHTRHPCISERPVFGWFVARQPFDFNSLDGEPVWFLTCTIVQPNNAGDHLRLLELTSRVLKEEQFVPVARKGARFVKEFLDDFFRE
jgi:nitrogen PTS system EIIA component